MTTKINNEARLVEVGWGLGSLSFSPVMTMTTFIKTRGGCEQERKSTWLL